MSMCLAAGLIILCIGWTDWKIPASWQKLQPKMTDQQVTALLGKPMDVENSDTSQVWYYQSRPVYNEDRIIERPKFGFVRFKKRITDGQETYILAAWKEPDWPNVPKTAPALLPAVTETAPQNTDPQTSKTAIQRAGPGISKSNPPPGINPPAPLPPAKNAPVVKPSVPQGTPAPKDKEFSINDLGSAAWLITGGIFIGLGIALAIIKGTMK